MSLGRPLPILCVEGADDVSVISALLKRHGVDTKQGTQHLYIKDMKNDETLLASMPDTIKASSDNPVGFVIDIDITTTNRWNAICGRLMEVGVTPPPSCPATGFFGQYSVFRHPFGVWLMPDCTTDDTKLEHLVQSLIPQDDPLWPHAKTSVTDAASLVDEANRKIAAENKRWKRFRDVDCIKAEVRTWLAWQQKPGAAFGEAINAKILEHHSPKALAFLGWLKQLYGFVQLQV